MGGWLLAGVFSSVISANIAICPSASLAMPLSPLHLTSKAQLRTIFSAKSMGVSQRLSSHVLGSFCLLPTAMGCPNAKTRSSAAWPTLARSCLRSTRCHPSGLRMSTVPQAMHHRDASSLRSASPNRRGMDPTMKEHPCTLCGKPISSKRQAAGSRAVSLSAADELGSKQAPCAACATQLRAVKPQASPVGARAGNEVKGAASAAGGEGAPSSPLRLFEGMNAQQLVAATTTQRHVLLSAGPGTGKTRVLTTRMALLLSSEQAQPHKVLALAFTNSAASELRAQLQRSVGSQADRVSVSTFHKLCLGLLRIHVDKLQPVLKYATGFLVYDDVAASQLVKRAYLEVAVMRQNGGKLPPGASIPTTLDKEEMREVRQVKATIGYLKNDGVEVDTCKHEVADVWRRYEELKQEANAIDYDDMLCLTLRLLEKQPDVAARYASRWSHIHVDEFQDTNKVQYAILRIIGRPHANLFVVGDADQSIYGWRGASQENTARIGDDFDLCAKSVRVPPAPVPAAAVESEQAMAAYIARLTDDEPGDGHLGVRLRLELNYRSRQFILDAAHALLKPAYKRRPKEQLQLLSARDCDAKAIVGQLVDVVAVCNPESEADYVTDAILKLQTKNAASQARPSIAILFRSQRQSFALEAGLVQKGIPFVKRGLSFLARKEVRDALAYLSVVHRGDRVGLERIINVPPRRIGPKAQATLAAHAAEHGISLWQAVCAAAAAADGTLPEGTPSPPLKTAARKSLSSFVKMIEKFRQSSCVEKEEPALAERGEEQEQVEFEAAEWSELAARGTRPVEVVHNIHNMERVGLESEWHEDFVPFSNTVGSLLRGLLKESGYEEYARKAEETEKAGDGMTGWDYVTELFKLGSLHRADDLECFLDQVALEAGIESEEAAASVPSPVQLMTVHASKGLEFDYVFVVGVQQGLFPHFFAVKSHEIDEERRLLYVAMTRAKDGLSLTHCTDHAWKWDFRRRSPVQVPPAPFLTALGPDLARYSKVVGSTGEVG